MRVLKRSDVCVRDALNPLGIRTDGEARLQAPQDRPRTVAVAVLLAILLAVGAFDALAARRKVARHGGDISAVEADETDSVPTMAVDPDVPLGASGESHTDLEPHDLPPDHPSRPAVEEHFERNRKT